MADVQKAPNPNVLAEERLSFEPPELPAATPSGERLSFEPPERSSSPFFGSCLKRAVADLTTAVEARGQTIRRLQSTPPPRPSE